MDNNFDWINEHLNDRRFVAADNAHGHSGSGTVFHYHVAREVITGTY